MYVPLPLHKWLVCVDNGKLGECILYVCVIPPSKTSTCMCVIQGSGAVSGAVGV